MRFRYKVIMINIAFISIAFLPIKWMNFPFICGGQKSEFGQKCFASSSSFTSGVPHTGQQAGNSTGTMSNPLSSSATLVILGIISPPFSTYT